MGILKCIEDVISRVRAWRQYEIVSHDFDKDFYLTSNPDVRESGMDPIKHYLLSGWKEGRNPRSDFDVRFYLRLYPDIIFSGMNPFYHYLVYGRANNLKTTSNQKTGIVPDETTDYLIGRSAHYVQDSNFPIEAETAENVMVILIPEHNEMSGGIYSFFSIAKAAYKLRHKHNYHVLLMTRPNPHDETYLRQRNFRNSEDVFRFEQIVRCRNAKSVYLHIPEYMTSNFVNLLDDRTHNYLRSRERLYVNILNQKTDIMPKKEEFEDLRALADELTQSVAHHAYFGQKFTSLYDTPMLLLPAYTDISEYDPIPFEEKDKLIIYSPDDINYRDAVLEALAKGLPDYKLREIRGITFDQYMDLATRCRFSITFGEGFDGYIAQPIHQGGIGFAVYNDEFFPSKELVNYYNIFASGEMMVSDIVDRIRTLERDPELYRRTNQAMIDVYNKLYSREDYLQRIEMLIHRQFEIYPLHLFEQANTLRL
ncbi:hypothetical protein [Acidithiobacillus sulfurivorans]|uniref:Glycosyltransferase family 1 protein n=1 Tax=Acidithiobacillus sulfurivorans TaxID=1958756 RepID=A0ABS5ZV25_9PROT|nr:hypothetical protein [Acidithiobacillus sulfurivorans]MBU2759071.1 hypothetical protein [Acidithiobacillus sulfurivorans]